MRSIIIVAVGASAALAGCTFKSTTVRRAETPPPAAVVYAQPAPTVVYQTPPTVVYQTPPTVVYQQQPVYNVPNQTVAVTYSGLNGFELAAQKADAYCDEHYGRSGVRLIRDDRSAGRATFACVN
jgi:hypothetical protein